MDTAEEGEIDNFFREKTELTLDRISYNLITFDSKGKPKPKNKGQQKKPKYNPLQNDFSRVDQCPSAQDQMLAQNSGAQSSVRLLLFCA